MFGTKPKDMTDQELINFVKIFVGKNYELLAPMQSHQSDKLYEVGKELKRRKLIDFFDPITKVYEIEIKED